jgi:hypothetical protein
MTAYTSGKAFITVSILVLGDFDSFGDRSIRIDAKSK